MGEVIVGLKVMPKTIEVNLDELEAKINESVKPDRIQRQPIAFGIVAFLVTKIIPDAGGELDKLTDKIKSIKEVGEVEVTGITKSL